MASSEGHLWCRERWTSWLLMVMVALVVVDLETGGGGGSWAGGISHLGYLWWYLGQ